MANDCAGTWKSSITWTKRKFLHIPPKPPQQESDGGFVIQPHGSATTFAGTHTNKNSKNHAMNQGQCVPSGGTFTVSFGRDDDDDQTTVEDREYTGKITTVGGKTVIHGTVKVFRGPGPTDGDTGTWNAERTGGGKGHGKGGQKSGKGAGAGRAGRSKKR